MKSNRCCYFMSGLMLMEVSCLLSLPEGLYMEWIELRGANLWVGVVSLHCLDARSPRNRAGEPRPRRRLCCSGGQWRSASQTVRGPIPSLKKSWRGIGIGETLDDWLSSVRDNHIRELQGFVRSTERDKAAVLTGLTLPESNGIVEGKVNKLKLLKRMGYGRAGFPLLRQRVLHAL